MKNKRTARLIPLITAVGAVLPACSDPIIGEWEVTRYKSKVFPKSDSNSDGSTGTYSADLIFEEDGDFEFLKTYTLTNTDGDVLETKSYRYLGSWAAEGGRTYKISGEEIGATLTCGIDANELECDDTAGERIFDAVPK